MTDAFEQDMRVPGDAGTSEHFWRGVLIKASTSLDDLPKGPRRIGVINARLMADAFGADGIYHGMQQSLTKARLLVAKANAEARSMLNLPDERYECPDAD